MKAAIKAYFFVHLGEASNAFRNLSSTKIASLMTVIVIGIALALPSSFLVFLTNAKLLANTLEGAPQISIFFKGEASDNSIQTLVTQFKADPKIAQVQYFSKEEALKEFSQKLNVSEIVNLLPENPLPPTLVLHLKEVPSQEELQKYLHSLGSLSEVEKVQVDLDWIQRLSGGLQVAERLVTGLTTLLALAVLMVVGNTLRLHVENKRDVIEVAKWVGATDAFVRRPFLYLGLWYGLFGSIIAVLIVYALSRWVGDAARELLALYQSNLLLVSLDIRNAALLLLLGALLGLGGAWLSVGRQLQNFRPN